MSSVAQAVRKQNLSASIMRPGPLNLADQLDRQLAAIKEHRYSPLGFMMTMLLGVSDDSAYFQDPVNKHLGPITKVQGLTLDWPQDVYPQIAEMQHGGVMRTEQFVFPRGVLAPPKIADPRYRRMNATDPLPPQIPQNIDHYASGVVHSREYGETFRVLQPVECIGVRTCGTLLRLFGKTNPANGTKVAFLYSPKRQVGFLVGGLLTFE